MFLRPQHSLRRKLEEGHGGEVLEGRERVATDDELYNLLREPCSKMLRQKFTLQELSSWRDPKQGERIRRAMDLFVEDWLADYQDGSGRRLSVTMGQRRRLVDRLMSACLGYGPLERFFNDPLVMEVVVARWDNVWLERAGERIKLPPEECFESEEHCRAVLDRMLEGTGRQVDLARPTVDARLPDGSRLKAQIPPVAVKGTTITIRRFRKDITAEKLVELGTISRELLEWLGGCVRGRLNVAVSGGTASGKSTFLNVLAGFIPGEEWIITIEDPAELQFDHPCVRSLEARPPNTEGKGEVTMLDLVRDALRMHPDRIVVGEVRGAEAYAMINAMNTGHDGSLTTLHANNVREALSRLVNMVLMANTGLPQAAIVDQIRAALDLIVHIKQSRQGRSFVRRVVEVAEILGPEAGRPGEFLLNMIWRYDYQAGTWVKVGELTEKSREKLAIWGVELA